MCATVQPLLESCMCRSIVGDLPRHRSKRFAKRQVPWRSRSYAILMASVMALAAVIVEDELGRIGVRCRHSTRLIDGAMNAEPISKSVDSTTTTPAGEGEPEVKGLMLIYAKSRKMLSAIAAAPWSFWLLSAVDVCWCGSLWPFVALTPDMFHRKWGTCAKSLIGG